MTQTSQIKKNFKLSTNLSNYIFDNPHTLGGLPNNASIVAFSEDDELLNKANNIIIKSLLNEGTVVIKAQETKKAKTSWKFTPVFP